jgi:cystathionine beta-lyase/cystathionine gamma-synthase
LAIAKLLEGHKKVKKCVYPGLKSHPNYDIHRKQSKGPGAMISLYVKGGLKQACTFLENLKVFTLAESLGGVESLAEHPVTMTHGSVPAAQRKILGIEDNFVRLSVGIEDEADLLRDIAFALSKM